MLGIASHQCPRGEFIDSGVCRSRVASGGCSRDANSESFEESQFSAVGPWAARGTACGSNWEIQDVNPISNSLVNSSSGSVGGTASGRTDFVSNNLGVGCHTRDDDLSTAIVDADPVASRGAGSVGTVIFCVMTISAGDIIIDTEQLVITYMPNRVWSTKTLINALSIRIDINIWVQRRRFRETWVAHVDACIDDTNNSSSTFSSCSGRNRAAIPHLVNANELRADICVEVIHVIHEDFANPRLLAQQCGFLQVHARRETIQDVIVTVKYFKVPSQ